MTYNNKLVKNIYFFTNGWTCTGQCFRDSFMHTMLLQPELDISNNNKYFYYDDNWNDDIIRESRLLKKDM